MARSDGSRQLDWCIGYFAGSDKTSIAPAPGANRAHIGRMRRPAQPVPTHAAPGGGKA